MKKLSAILLVAVMVLACVACGNSKNSGCKFVWMLVEYVQARTLV